MGNKATGPATSMGGGKRYTANELVALASDVLSRSEKIKNELVSAQMVAAIALVESSGNPTACRFEKHLGEASAGLTQVLISTASWLASDMGFDEYGVPRSEESLYDPEVAIYFALAYLTWLRTCKNIDRSDEFVVRGYNGGPGGIDLEVTEHYWRKYQDALRCVAPQSSASQESPPVDSAHVIRKGETLYGVAKANGLTVDDLLRANPGIDPKRLQVGQSVRLS